jgi:hypothetical protein
MKLLSKFNRGDFPLFPEAVSVLRFTAISFPVQPNPNGDLSMKAHALSFIKAPIGYLFNFVAHFNGSQFVCWGCETFCLQDGIQDDCWF